MKRNLIRALTVALVASGCSSDAGGPRAVRAAACGYVTNIGLFGGPQQKEGCGQPAPTNATSSPSVELPGAGSATPVTATDADGARASYGPAAVFHGVWPRHVATAPPSGPISVSVVGTPGGGSVTSSVDIVLRSPPDTVSPGGFGAGPVEANEVHSTCTATGSEVSGRATFVNGVLTTSTDSQGEPATQEPIPDDPPPNYTRSVTINNVGGHPTVVLNEHVVNPDGSLTVNALHMYLFGPVGVGEAVVGQVTCGTTPSPVKPTDTTPPTCGVPVLLLADPTAPGSPPKQPLTATIGVLDAGGLKAIDDVRVTNGRIQLGNPGGFGDAAALPDYLRFVPGQKGPLAVNATQDEPERPTTLSFEATDTAGNRARCDIGDLLRPTPPP